MTPSEYQAQAMSTNKDLGSWRENMFHATLGIASEAGEIADEMKAHLVYGKKLDFINLVGEIGDELWFLTLMIQELGLTIEDIMEANIAKLSARYEEGYSDAKALGRNKEFERAAIKRVLDKRLKNQVEELMQR